MKVLVLYLLNKKGWLLLKYKIKTNLEPYLKERGIQKVWLAEKTGVTKQQISRWSKNDESGFCKYTPSLSYALVISKVLDCDIKEIFELIELK
ncbi:helix-turn-helix domain-containing protein [Bacillus velezensis]|nr:helix-turn-helix transcriptional regulator [Bacillus amyloliquefaciens]QMI88257.1 helix-turn-helix domain-containing protein [Bacillus velezensis]QMT26488.1 helix-turn-helix domain-containing protein [Bacillus velezensis]QXP98917.1 helix-turn-helix transcriptional regulator [Bacillus velezensis]QZY21262.1 helix-turn-helix transcriptional regulator [Bacillus amyloliquefaciens]